MKLPICAVGANARNGAGARFSQVGKRTKGPILWGEGVRDPQAPALG